MHQLNEQLLITFECVSAIGTSLQLDKMVHHFLRIFSRKTGALASAYWLYHAQKKQYEEICFLGKQAFKPLFKPTFVPPSDEPILVMQLGEKSLLLIRIDHDWMAFLFCTNDEAIEHLKSMVSSFLDKLENAVHACKNHAELIEINQNLERRIEEEVRKNREMDQHILQQSRLAQMGEMISMIAHQWRQPLGSISTVAASIKLKLSLNRLDFSTTESQESSKQFLLDAMQKVESYVLFLTHTIDDFRNFFKPNKQKENVTLEQLLLRTLDIIGNALEINGIRVHLDVQMTEPLCTYANEVTQVILNILKNAEDVIKERCPKEPSIWIRINAHKNGWQSISIEDNAGGIPRKVMPKIFEPYFSTKSEKNGSGLGLYMSKIIIEEHCEGTITASNTQEGACFVIRLKGAE